MSALGVRPEGCTVVHHLHHLHHHPWLSTVICRWLATRLAGRVPQRFNAFSFQLSAFSLPPWSTTAITPPACPLAVTRGGFCLLYLIGIAGSALFSCLLALRQGFEVTLFRWDAFQLAAEQFFDGRNLE